MHAWVYFKILLNRLLLQPATNLHIEIKNKISVFISERLECQEIWIKDRNYVKGGSLCSLLDSVYFGIENHFLFSRLSEVEGMSYDESWLYISRNHVDSNCAKIPFC